jgi:anti-sigma B factor antagonist
MTMLRQVDKTDRPPAGAPRFDIVREDLDERTCVIAAGGDLDLSSAPQLKWTLLDALEEGHGGLVLDLSRATFMDSTALGVLIGVNRSLALGARLALAGARHNVLNIFELSGMDAAFAMFSTLEEALAYVRGDAADDR